MFLIARFLCMVQSEPSTVQRIPESSLRMQENLLRIFFEEINDHFFNFLGGRSAIERICGWHPGKECEIQCIGKEVTYIRFTRLGNGNFNIAFVPNSVENLCIAVCAQRYSINTRLLPRKAKNIDFRLNKIFGTINLRSLPGKLESLDISENQLTGTICITRLPESMQALWIYRNYIDQPTLYYDYLPSGLATFDITRNYISEVRSIDDFANPRAKAIFRGVEYEKIW